MPKFTFNILFYYVKKIILFVLISIVSLNLVAQDSTDRKRPDRKAEKRERINAIIKQEEEGNLSFRKQNAFGIMLRSNGYGLFYELGKRRSPRYSNLYLIELTEIKHRKEDKLGGAENFFSNSYVFGKQNNFYQFKLGFGQQYILGQKGNKNGVAITANVTGGLTMGLLKPYYIQAVDSTGREVTISYEKDSVTFLSRGSIIGGAGFTEGWSELKLRPGLFAKAALRFDFKRYNDKIEALEVGVSVEGYAQKIPQMVFNEPRRLFFQGHVALVFGGRK